MSRQTKIDIFNYIRQVLMHKMEWRFRLVVLFSSLHADCLTKKVRQFRLETAINRQFECSVFGVQEEAEARHSYFFPEL